jgi:hypothetical protein
MTDVDDQFPPTPPIRNESARNYVNSFSTNSTNSSALSTSISLTSTNTSYSVGSAAPTSHNHHHSHNLSLSPIVDVNSKPLPKTPDEYDEMKKKSKLKQTKG